MVKPRSPAKENPGFEEIIRRVIKRSRRTRLPLKGLKMIEKFIVLVKRQIAHYEGQITKFTPDHPRYRSDKIALYKRISTDLRELLDYLLTHRDQVTPGVPDGRGPSPDMRVPQEDLSDLPPELLAELSDAVKGQVDPIIQIIDARGGVASLDEILIDLYRKHKELGKRNIVANKLYRLAKRELIWSVPGKKGVYTTAPTATGEEEEDIDEDNGNQNEEGSGGGTPEPLSIDHGGSRSPGSPSKATPVGSSPTTSTLRRRELFAGAAIPPVRVPQK